MSDFYENINLMGRLAKIDKVKAKSLMKQKSELEGRITKGEAYVSTLERSISDKRYKLANTEDIKEQATIEVELVRMEGDMSAKIDMLNGIKNSLTDHASSITDILSEYDTKEMAEKEEQEPKEGEEEMERSAKHSRASMGWARGSTAEQRESVQRADWIREHGTYTAMANAVTGCNGSKELPDGAGICMTRSGKEFTITEAASKDLIYDGVTVGGMQRDVSLSATGNSAGALGITALPVAPLLLATPQSFNISKYGGNHYKVNGLQTIPVAATPSALKGYGTDSGTADTTDTLKYNNASLKPHPVRAFTQVGRTFLQGSGGVAFDQVITKQLSDLTTRYIDHQLFAGAVVESSQLGWDDLTGVTAYVHSSGPLTLAQLRTFRGTGDGANFTADKTCFVTNPKVREIIRSLSSSANTGVGIFDPSGSVAGASFLIDGVPTFVSTLVPTDISSANNNALFYLDATQFYTAIFGSPTIIVDEYTGAGSSIIKFHSQLYVDQVLIRPAAMTRIKTITS